MINNVTKTNRRQYGSGSVSRRASDGRWVGTIAAGWTTKGTRRRITVTANTEAECKRLLERKKGEIARQGLPTEGATRATIKSWADQWLTHTQRTVRPKTWQTNRSAVTKWIVPTIGGRRLDLLNPGDIRAVDNAVRDALNAKGEPMAITTVVRTHVVLMQMLNAALDEGLNVPAPTMRAKTPKPGRSTRGAIPHKQTMALLATAKGLPDGSRWFAALLLGLRQGEALGLTWDRVDLIAGQADISWQLQPIPYIKGRSGALRVPDGYECHPLHGQLCLVRPKSYKGERIMDLAPIVVAMLAEWKAHAPESPHGLVWPQQDGHPQRPQADRAAWHVLQDLADVKASGRYYLLHEARHSAATHLLGAGILPEVIKEMLGHSDIITTMEYAHVSRELTKRAADALAADLMGD